MTPVEASDRLRKWASNWKDLSVVILSAMGVAGLGIQVLLFPIIHRPTNGTTCQYCLAMALGLPIRTLLHALTKE